MEITALQDMVLYWKHVYRNLIIIMVHMLHAFLHLISVAFNFDD
jgi:hypothetical protein